VSEKELGERLAMTSLRKGVLHQVDTYFTSLVGEKFVSDGKLKSWETHSEVGLLLLSKVFV
jgi:hypothetical protein